LKFAKLFIITKTNRFHTKTGKAEKIEGIPSDFRIKIIKHSPIVKKISFFYKPIPLCTATRPSKKKSKKT